MKRLLAVSFLVLIGSTQLALSAERGIVGKWRSALIPFAGGIAKMKVQFDFSEDQKCVFKFETYVNSQFGNRAAEFRHDCTYQLLGEKKVDLTIQKTLLTMLTAMDVEEANKKVECGISDWVLGQPRDISDRECEDHSSDLKPGTVMKDIYELDVQKNLLFLGTDFAYDESAGDPETRYDSEGRPLTVSRRVGFAGEGTVPPPVQPRPQPEDHLTGVYEFDSMTFNAQGCQSEGAPEAFEKKFLYMFPMSIVFPVSLPGWLGKECRRREDCNTPDGFMFDARWAANAVTSDNSWVGQLDTSTQGIDSCKYTRNEIEIVRNPDGQFVFSSKIKFAEGAISAEGKCDTKDPKVKDLLSRAACSSLRVARAHRVD